MVRPSSLWLLPLLTPTLVLAQDTAANVGIHASPPSPIPMASPVETGPALPLPRPRSLWLGGGLGYFSLSRPPYADAPSLGLHLNARYHLTDQFVLLGELSLASFRLEVPAPSPCPEPPAPCEKLIYPFPVVGTTLTVGAVYTIDVTRLLPYVGVLVGGSRLSSGDGFFRALAGQAARELRFDWLIALGADYHLTDRWSVGAGVRLHMIQGDASMTHLLLQAQRRFF